MRWLLAWMAITGGCLLMLLSGRPLPQGLLVNGIWLRRLLVMCALSPALTLAVLILEGLFENWGGTGPGVRVGILAGLAGLGVELVVVGHLLSRERARARPC